jgi:hypothetical protein
MIRVRLHAPRGVGPDKAGFSRDVQMPAVPSVGDTVSLGAEDTDGSACYRVHAVDWTPDEPLFDVYVVLR